MSQPLTWAEVVALAQEAMREVAAQPLTEAGDREVVRLINVIEDHMNRISRSTDANTLNREWAALGRALNASYRAWYVRYRVVVRERALEQLREDLVAIAQRAVALGTAGLS